MHCENPYEVLGLTREASDEEVRLAYEKLCTQEDRKDQAQAAYDQILEMRKPAENPEEAPEEPAEKAATGEPEQTAEEKTEAEEAADTAAEAEKAEDTPAEAEKADKETEEAPQKPEMKKGAATWQIALAVAAIIGLAAILIALIVSALGGKSDGKENVLPETQPAVAATETPAEPQVPQVTVPATVPADGNPDDETCKGSYSGSDEEVLAAADQVVASMDGYQLTNAELQIYYWMGIQSYVQNSGPYIQMMGIDLSRPLDTQPCPLAEGQTWQQFFLRQALDSWQKYQAMAAEAAANGHDLTEEMKTALEELPAQMEQQAKDNGFEDAKALLANNVGVGASIEDYVRFMEVYNTGYDYFAATLEASQPTDEQLETYYKEHESELQENGISKDAKVVSARHILIAPENQESEEDWTKAEENARNLLEQFLAGEATEEAFAKLASENTMDPGSQQTGGLYTDIIKGQMVPEFDQWCFDGSRQTGDTDIVKTSYGYHIMYYVNSRPIWQEQVSQVYLNDLANRLINDGAAKYPVDIDFASVVLGELKTY